MIRVLLVDDHHLIRAGVRAMLETSTQIQIIGEADSGDKALELTSTLSIDIAVLDVRMPGIPVLELIQKLRALSPPIYSVILTAHHDESLVPRLLHAGASGYVTKFCERDHLLEAILKAAKGERYLSPDISKQLAYQALNQTEDFYDGKNLLKLLSDREVETLKHLAKGKTIKIIAQEFGVNPKTINTYRYRIFKKLQVSNDVDLIKLIARSNLLEE